MIALGSVVMRRRQYLLWLRIFFVFSALNVAHSHEKQAEVMQHKGPWLKALGKIRADYR